MLGQMSPDAGARIPVFARRIALAAALIAGLIGSQGPEFAQQYRQRIGGALDELKRIVAQFQSEAANQGLGASEAASRLEQNSDVLARERGQDMVAILERERRLQAQLDAMASAGPIARLYVMVKDWDPAIARRTLDAYEPAAPVTLEAAAAAGLTAILGWAAAHVFFLPFRLAFRARRRERGTEPVISQRTTNVG